MKNLSKYFGKSLFLVIGIILFILGFLLDIVNKNVESYTFHVEFIKIASFVFIYFFIKASWKRESVPLRRIIAILILGALLIGITFTLSSNSEFIEKSNYFIPQNFLTIFISNILSLIAGTSTILILFAIKDIYFFKQRKNTPRNFFIIILLLLLTSISNSNFSPFKDSFFPNILMGFFIITSLVVSFKMPWIVYLKKKDKALTILFAFLVLVVFIILRIMYQEHLQAGKLTLYYSHSLSAFISLTYILVSIYSAIAFMSTVFHLPTADAFDKKITEVTSLQNLSKLITQVLDYEELVNTVIRTTLEVLEAKSAWLAVNLAYGGKKEITEQDASNSTYPIVAQMNISLSDIKIVNEILSDNLRDLIIKEQKPMLIHNFRMEHAKNKFDWLETKLGSLIVVPLVARSQLIGILYAAKDIEYGFDTEDLEIASAFADQAAVAVDNSKLIEKSIERERLLREIHLAQGMQKKLLPQSLPEVKSIEIEAFFSPAFEVGGDYYDFLMIDNKLLALVIGDVSGKGISAAFYMSEMKGVFQSLCRIYTSPKEFLLKANEVISASIDKRSFISLIYAILDLETGILKTVRAGHCPMIHSSGNETNFIRPNGIGLGMGNNILFEKYIQEYELFLKPGDVLVFYTDGITEAHGKDGEEFGYNRLLETVKFNRDKPAIEIRNEIISEVIKFTNNEPHFDDITLIILRWFGKNK